MAGTWMSIVEGFAGMKKAENALYFSPFLPEAWNRYSFHLNYQGALLHITVSESQVSITNKSPFLVKIGLYEQISDLVQNEVIQSRLVLG